MFLALGSNLGDRLANLQTAIALMTPDVLVLAKSPVYETPPWGYLEQPAFLNQVIRAQTELSPDDLLVFLKQLETRMGRLPTERNRPRVIDLDILFYDNLVYASASLSIPHPRMQGRAFVLVPLADLAPDLLHPVLGKTTGELADEADQSGITLFAS